MQNAFGCWKFGEPAALNMPLRFDEFNSGLSSFKTVKVLKKKYQIYSSSLKVDTLYFAT